MHCFSAHTSGNKRDFVSKKCFHIKLECKLISERLMRFLVRKGLTPASERVCLEGLRRESDLSDQINKMGRCPYCNIRSSTTLPSSVNRLNNNCSIYKKISAFFFDVFFAVSFIICQTLNRKEKRGVPASNQRRHKKIRSPSVDTRWQCYAISSECCYVH